MKLCLICSAKNDEKSPTCVACGEGSFTAYQGGAPKKAASKPAEIPLAAPVDEPMPWETPEPLAVEPALEPVAPTVPRRRR